jgi:hypothetical protein
VAPRINSIKKVDGTVSYEKLAEAVSQSEPLSKPPKTLRLQDIDVAEPGVFQWRIANENVFQSEANTLDMISALKDPGKPLEPILVFPAGGRFYVMDGHHRLDAYRTVKWGRPIPVEMFRGTLEEAHKEALKRNSRNKLSMSKREKSEAAWALVKEGRCSKSEIAELATVGLRTVGNMRATWKALREKEPEGAALDYTWTDALRWAHGWAPDDDADDWKEREAQKIVDALRRHKIAGPLLKHLDITAIALERLDPHLPAFLMHEWAASHLEVVEELAAREDLLLMRNNEPLEF